MSLHCQPDFLPERTGAIGLIIGVGPRRVNSLAGSASDPRALTRQSRLQRPGSRPAFRSSASRRNRRGSVRTVPRIEVPATSPVSLSVTIAHQRPCPSSDAVRDFPARIISEPSAKMHLRSVIAAGLLLAFSSASAQTAKENDRAPARSPRSAPEGSGRPEASGAAGRPPSATSSEGRPQPADAGSPAEGTTKPSGRP